MKYMYAALLALGVLNTGLVQAKVEYEKKPHVIKKKSVYKKTSKPEAKPAHAKSSHTQSYRKKPQHKTPVYKNVTKRASTSNATAAAAPVAATAAATVPATTNKATDETAYQKFTNWLGFGAGAGATTATTAAAKQALIGHHRAAGYHTGPRKEKWNHKFESYWGNRGFEEGVNQYGHWVFGSYRPDWWEKNYPIYWKDVVGPLYRKSAEYQKTLGK